VLTLPNLVGDIATATSSGALTGRTLTERVES
jgi:hypothetical protein